MKTSSSNSRAKTETKPAAAADFDVTWWCRSAHIQTLWPTLFRHRPRIAARRERLELPDGDFIDLDWSKNATGPVVVILHGLEGSSQSPYARGIFSALERHGMRPLVMHFRGCSGEPNRLSRGYHSGDTGDFDFLLRTLRQREPDAPIAAIGYSLGGNVLLKWLGEVGSGAGIFAAAAVSVPFELQVSALRLDIGLSRIYQTYLLTSLKRSLRRKFRNRTPPYSAERAAAARNFWEFDEAVTAPLHGFAGASDYYARSSSRQYLAKISIPTLMVQAVDDPFMSRAVIPGPDELPPTVTLELHAHGGHVGFITGRWPWRPVFWLEQRIPRFLAHQLTLHAAVNSATAVANTPL